MPSIHDTAYPRLKNTSTTKELADLYTPTADEIALANRVAKGSGAKICFLVLLKTFQRLGHFIMLNKVPQQIAEHIALLFAVDYSAVAWQAYDESGTRRRHVAVIRDHLNVRTFDETARQLLIETIRQAARIKEDTVDIINIAIEELVRCRYELPGFTTLLEEAQHGRAEVNRCFYASVCDALGTHRCNHIDELLDVDQPNKRSLWQAVKVETGGATLLQFRYLLERLKWLTSLDLAHTDFLAAVPATKVEHFALEAKSLDAGRMSEMEPRKRYTLAAALVRQQIARCLDDLGEMLVKRMRKAHRSAQNALAE